MAAWFRILSRREIYSPILRGGQPPVPVSVDISSAQKLELVVDYADRAGINSTVPTGSTHD